MQLMNKSKPREQTVRTIPKKRAHKQRHDSVSQCNSSTVSDLILLEKHARQCCVALWLLLPSAECPARKAGLSEKSCMLTERFNRGSLPWWWMKPSTLDARHLMSQDLCQPMSCGVVPAKMCSTASRRFLSMSQAALAQQWRPRASVQRKMSKHREQIKWN